VGAGIQISPNGMAVIRSLGLEEALTAASVRAEAVHLIDGPSGSHVTTLHVKRDAPDLHWALVHRAELIALLLDAAQAAGVTVETGQDITPPSDGAALAGDDLLIGADGLHSAMRDVLLDDSAPFFTGQVAWRAVIDDPDAAPEIEVHMGAKRHLVSYPLTKGRRNIVAVEERAAWTEEGWSHTDDPGTLRAAFAGFAPKPRAWLDQVETTHIWGLFRHPVASRWYSAKQVMLGDAAHPTLPFLAQGANLALEDAAVLARVLRENGDLADYQIARQLRARRVIDAASANARNYHLSGPKKLAAHAALRLAGKLAPKAALRRFDWLYRFDATKG
jgi:salicylate hydroxylase